MRIIVLEHLKPRLVWDIFENIIAKTPRCSKSEEKIREKIKEFIKESEKKNHISYSIKEDKIGNLSIQRRATEGYQNYPSIIFQAHMDMVCETNLQEGFNFKQNGIPLRIQENEKWVDAIGTTLGADDGIGVAFALALLVDSDLKCGKIISLFTVNEEDGFDGANYLEPEKLNLEGNFYVNLDSGPINEITIGSVGGRRVYLRKNFEFFSQNQEKLKFYKLKVQGLLGGHSGGDIHLPRANANKIIARLMTVLNKDIEIFISEWRGGSKANVIPRNSQIIFAIYAFDESKLKEVFKKEKQVIFKYYVNEMKKLEPNMSISIEDVENRKAFSRKDSINIIATANLIPHGVINVSPLYEDFIHTSSNFGVIRTNENEVEFQSYPRSIWRTELNALVNKFDQLANFNKWEIELRPILPEWSPKPNSQFIQFVKTQYERVVNQEVKLHLVHGGLETGMISNKLPKISMVSLGPTVEDNHSPNERLKIEDVGVLYRVLKNIVMNINEINN